MSISDPVVIRDDHATWRYVTPFVVFMVLLLAAANIPMNARWEAPLRCILSGAVCFVCWPRPLSLRPVYPLASIAVGAAVFGLWIAPDVLIPGYRQSIWFSNSLVGHLHSSMQPASLRDPWVLVWRSVRAVVIVPIVEELFWRGWLVRWFINTDFGRVPLGAYSSVAFWLTAVLFGSEHGPYWDVGLLTGIIYNLWMIRTKSVASCILTHAVTNALLSAYVIDTARWQYWQ